MHQIPVVEDIEDELRPRGVGVPIDVIRDIPEEDMDPRVIRRFQNGPPPAPMARGEPMALSDGDDSDYSLSSEGER